MMFEPRRLWKVNPFVKWAGGKAQILPEIRRKFPPSLGQRYTKYAEPFVGGGAVLFYALNNFTLSKVYISDINRELIHTYKTIRDEVKELIDYLTALKEQYLPANNETREILYYQSRDRFNSLKAESSMTTEIAALFIFLNRLCYNGLYRVNSKGWFNVPFGCYKNPKIFDTANLLAISKAIKDVEIVWGDYQLARGFIDDKTFAYFDPPYRPLSNTAKFTSYAKDTFGDPEQIKLAKFIDEMSSLGAYVLASNSDPKNTDPSDNFFDNLYAKHQITRLSASRMINSKGERRGCIREILISPIEDQKSPDFLSKSS